MSLIGSLDEVQLADVLRLFAAGKKSGTLTIERAAGPAAQLHFHKGALVHASCASLAGEHVVLQLFGWREGQMTFLPDERPVPPNVTRAVDVLIADGLKSGAALHRIQNLVPSDRAVFHWGPGPEDETLELRVTRREWRLLQKLDGLRDVREVVAACGLPRDEALDVLSTWIEAGFVEKIELQKSLRVQAQGLFGKDTAELDARHEDDWRRIQRFSGGVLRIELRTLTGKHHTFSPTFRSGLQRDIQLSRQALNDLGLQDREEVFVKPIG